ncbi:MAG: uroporphyrinogen decarboxylase [Candidatus Lambdaproteobacteria bacterium]|nr:uroporphyrinogen decarboxylase [Candidatus Lambdaproteobacteria bacterium]
MPPLANDLLLRAINHEPVPRVPVWLMRQAGRSDPAYLAYRERAGLSLHALFRHPEHAVELTLLPKRAGVDALILFQDILTPLEPMGADFTFAPGPVLAAPLRSAAQLDALRRYEPAARLGFVAAAIRGVLRRLGGELPLLGFAGAPFTLAAFLIEGRSPGRMEATFALMREQPAAFRRLLGRLTEMTIAYLALQAEAGVHAVQLFESMGDLVPRDLYEAHVQESHQRIAEALAPRLPLILFVKGSPYPELMLKSGAPVLSLGEQAPLGEILRRGGGRVAVQGNVDNRLLAAGPPEAIARAVRACIAATGGRGHILNLNHGILAATPWAHVERFVQAARETALPA